MRHASPVRRPRHFPGYQAGASLKRFVSRGHGPVSSELPRLPSRGLIEAASHTPTSRTSPDFPGYQAGASLKLLSWDGGGMSNRHFPGYQAGASLKPGRPHGVRHRPRHFPGYQAGASLKLRALLNITPSYSAYFPGYQAGASLKLCNLFFRSLIDVKLPRLPSRGLIEARVGLMVRCWHRVLPRLPSRGLIEAGAMVVGGDASGQLPRLPSRGLIEAVLRVAHVNQRKLTSPVTKPGPH